MADMEEWKKKDLDARIAYEPEWDLIEAALKLHEEGHLTVEQVFKIADDVGGDSEAGDRIRAIQDRMLNAVHESESTGVRELEEFVTTNKGNR